MGQPLSRIQGYRHSFYNDGDPADFSGIRYRDMKMYKPERKEAAIAFADRMVREGRCKRAEVHEVYTNFNMYPPHLVYAIDERTMLEQVVSQIAKPETRARPSALAERAASGAAA